MQGEIQGRTVEIEAVTGRNDESDDSAGTPRASIASMARGNAASDVLVQKAIVPAQRRSQESAAMGLLQTRGRQQGNQTKDQQRTIKR